MHRLLFHEEVLEELRQAHAWYHARSIRAAQAFLDELTRGLLLIAQNPLQWPALDRDHRGHVLRRYPYCIVYSIEADHLFVAAVAHTKRRPGYWKKRRKP